MSTMEEQLDQIVADDWGEQFALSLDRHRGRARGLLDEQRARLGRVEKSLAEQTLALADEFRGELRSVDDRQRQLQQQTELLAQQAAQLTELKQQVAQQQNRWEQLSSSMAEQNAAFLAEFDRRHSELDQRNAELDRRSADLDLRHAEFDRRRREAEAETRRLDDLRRDLERREQQVAQQRASWESDRARLNAREAELEQSLRDLSAAAQEREEDAAELARQQRELESQQVQLHRREVELRQLTERTRVQRRSISQQLRSRHAELLADVERRRAEVLQVAAGEESDLSRQLAQATVQCDRLREEVAQRDHRLAELAQRLTSVGQDREQQQAQGDQQRRDWDTERNAWQEERAEWHRNQSAAANAGDEIQRLQSELEQARAALAAGSQQRAGVDEELCQLREERHVLAQQLAEAERRWEQNSSDAHAASAESHGELDDLRERLQMAVHELREVKASNTELKKKLSATCSTASSPANVASGDGQDWESQKRRMLAQLEADFDENDEKQQRDKLNVVEAIRLTDHVVAEKEQEIQELRQLLENQSGSFGGVAVGAAAIAEILDQNELICQERENLQQMQEEWRAKLRLAEVDISVERAKLARQRAELDERLRMHEASDPDDHAGDSNGKGKKSGRGRWLTRLGLKDGND